MNLETLTKNQTGRYVVNLERQATNTNTETGVLACVIAGDYVAMAHTANGTMTFSINGSTTSATFGATSVYESLIFNSGSQEDVKKLEFQVQNVQLPAR